MKKINVALYGGKSIFGGREMPLEAEITYCNKCEHCDFYKNNKCYSAGRFKANCKFGKKEKINGYTSRAKKYHEFRNTYKNDECYGKLEEPHQTVGIIDNIVVLNIHDMKLDENDTPIEDVGFASNSLSYIELDKFTPELIKQICDLRPRTIFGYQPIKTYYEEYIPKFLDDLKRHYPEIFRKFIELYPEYDKEMNYVGRSAYIHSLRNGVEIKSEYSDGTLFVKDGDYLTNVSNFKCSFMPFDSKESNIQLKIDKNMYCKITDNSQVDENTLFRD